jgi:rhamnose utilization protein RhaD (predicted bifunctional aldolase and dehydrogenase)
MNNRHRRDSNHKEIVKQLRQIPGLSVLDLSQIGGGCPDLLVSNKMLTALVELKTDKRDNLRESQKEFRKYWNGKIFKATKLEDILYEFYIS